MAQNSIEKKQVFKQPAATNQFSPRLGVVISEQSVRLCLSRVFGAKTTILETRTIPLESENQSDPIEWINQATTIVVDFLQKQKRPRIPVNVGLLMRGVGFRRINLPGMPAAELAQAIAWEGNKLFPFDFSKCAVHYDIVGRIKNKSAAKLDVNIIAADNEIINTLYSSFKSAGLKMGQVNFLPYHLSRLLIGHKGVEPDQRNLILYLDSEQSMAVFVHNGYLEFYQQFVTQPKAAGEAQTGIANIEAIGEELTTFLDLYGAQDSTRSINSIYLCGKFGWGKDAAEIISNRTGLPCVAAQAPESPLHNYTGEESSEINDSIAAVTTSAAVTNRYPLAPDKFRAAVEKSSLIRRVSVAAALTLLFLGSWHYLQYRTEIKINNQMLARQAGIMVFEQSPAYIAYVNLTHRLNRSKAYLEGISNKRASHTHLLIKALSMNIPRQLSLTGFDLQLFEGRYTLQLDGNVRLKDFSPEIILAQYVEDLRKSPLFDNLIVTSHQKRQINKEFELTFQLTLDARV